jgi:type IVB pilus formation R64 PilN family outer membrane protein
MTSKFKLTSIAAMVMAVFASGCASIHERVDQNVVKSADEVSQIARAAEPVSTAVPLVSKVKGAWVSNKKPMIELPKSDPLPDVFQTDYTYDYPGSAKLSEVISALTRTTKLQVRFAPELLSNSKTSASSGAPNPGGSSASLPGLPSALPGAAPAGGANAPTTNSTGAFPVAQGASSSMSVDELKFNGSVSGFLDLLSSKMQVSWKYDRGQVLLYKYDTRTFNVKALAGKGSSTSSVSASSGSSSTSAGGSGTTAATTTSNGTNMVLSSDLWMGVQQSVRVMLSDAGRNNFYASPDLGTLTITDEPDRLERVSTYLEKLNKDLGRQVSLHLAVYNVEIDETDTVGVDWAGVWDTANKFNGTFGGVTNTGGTSLQKLGINILKGPFANTKFVIGALNQVGKTSLVTRGQIMTMNRQSAPLQVVDEQSYLAKSTTTVSNGTSTTSLEPGVVVTGFSATVTPKIEEDGDILLQFAGDISDLKKMSEFTSGTSSLQLPQKTVRDFLQRVRIRSGETLVLTGFEQSINRSDDQGVGSSKNVLAGKQFANGKRVSIVILVTPYVID